MATFLLSLRDLMEQLTEKQKFKIIYSPSNRYGEQWEMFWRTFKLLFSIQWKYIVIRGNAVIVNQSYSHQNSCEFPEILPTALISFILICFLYISNIFKNFYFMHLLSSTFWIPFSVKHFEYIQYIYYNCAWNVLIQCTVYIYIYKLALKLKLLQMYFFNLNKVK